ncbi:MAG: glycosyltransferase [Bacteroidales bacterium]|nr:glycosyltransferase [Bacteroidales bacterium]
MQLSVVIVNYNVSRFLEQCLLSVRKAAQKVETEIWVVDNNSVDDSVDIVHQRFPEVKLIANKSNLGFAKANNQAIQQALGKYILLLNPDTVVEEDTFEKVIAFMENHPEAGGLGVKMVDGSGKFLPESKRGLPRPSTAFYKIFGLAALFPHSKRFSRYHMGFLDENQIHAVDVLAGAFMLLRKSTLDKTGLLDETFFMYGEDVDLSYRITQAGYKNYYFPETRIIHYKGESTRKSSANYVLVFYQAMIIFAKKHFTGKNARLLTFFINVAVYFRAFLALLSRFFAKTGLVMLDSALLLGGAWGIMNFWQENIISKHGGIYPALFIWVYIPVYVMVWVLSIYFSGGYDKPVKIRKLIQGIFLGTVVILIVYSLLREDMRFSRGQILADTLWTLLVLPAVRLLMNWMNIPAFQLENRKTKRFLIIGDKEESSRVENILQKTYLIPCFIGKVYYKDVPSKPEGFIGTLRQVKDIITIFHIDEVIFCGKNLSQQTIIDKMNEWKAVRISFKIAPEDSLSIIGSHSIHSQGELYTVEVNLINKASNKRNKRLLDVLLSLVFFITYPLTLFVVEMPWQFLGNIIRVFTGKKSWVGYHMGDAESDSSSQSKAGILTPTDGMKQVPTDVQTIRQLNLLYIRDYSLLKDLNIIFYAFRKLGKV